MRFIQKFIFIILLSSTISSVNAEGRRIANAWELPPLNLNDLNGDKRQLYDWHGKVIMLNFWATWCGPCQLEIPDFIQYQSEFADKGLQIIGVGLDEVRKLTNFVRTVGINYPILQADPERQYELLNQWGDPFGVLPFTVVIAPDGRLIFMQQGVLSPESFDKYVKPLLQQ
jgi:thiol-disulfide isomerase/thioredoxin